MIYKVLILTVSLIVINSAHATMNSFNVQWLNSNNDLSPIMTHKAFNDIQLNSKDSPPQTTISNFAISKLYTPKIVTNSFDHIIKDECQPYYLQQQLGRLLNSKQFDVVLTNYFNRCGNGLNPNINSKYADLARLGLRKHEATDSSNVNKFKLNLDNGGSVRGFLALKKGKKRPLVIVKCGVFCDGTSSVSTNMIISAIYDSGPFHLVMLASHSGEKNIEDNKRINLSGFIEGQEIIKVADWVKNHSDFKSLVSEVHVLGISLGGNAALFSALYNDHLNNTLINSVIGFCPVVNLEKSIKDVTTKGLLGTLVRAKILNIVHKNEDNIPYLNKHFNLSRLKYRKKMPDVLADSTLEYISNIDPGNFLQPFTGVSLHTREHYHHYNNFKSHLSNLKTPTFLWASRNDPVVRYKNNTALINNSYVKANNNIEILAVDKGSHCGLQESYGSFTVAMILNDFFLQHSPSLLKTIEQVDINFKQPRLKKLESFLGTRLLSFPNTKKLIIEYKIDSPLQKNNPYRYATTELDFADLPFKLYMPTNATEAHILTRWLNANVFLKIDDKLFVTSESHPNKLEWFNYTIKN